MEWTEEGLSIIVPDYEHKLDLKYESKEDYFYVPARKYEIEWNKVF